MSRVVIHNAALKRFLTSREGPVGRHVQKKADQIQAAAAANIAENLDERSGDLAASLKQIPFDRDGVPHIAVGADAQHGHERPSGAFPYARALETGINPLTGASMKFYSDFSYMVPAVIAAGFRPRG